MRRCRRGDGGGPGGEHRRRQSIGRDRSARPKPGQHIRSAGEDVTAGTTVLRAGQVVTPAALGLAAALGLGELTVIPRQRVLVISTGSELVAAGTPLQPGQIYESNAVMLAAAVREAGAEVVGVATCGDDVGQFRAVLDAYAGRGRPDHHLRRGERRRLRGGQGCLRRRRGATGRGVRQGRDAARYAAGRGTAGRRRGASSPCPATRSARWCPSRCSSGPRCAPRWACRIRTGRGARAVSPRRSPRRRGKRQFRRGVYDPHTGTVTSYGPPASHHLRWLASANCLLDIAEDVTELAAGEQVAALGPA